MATEIKEVRIAHTGISIVCDKSGGKSNLSVIQSMTKRVLIDDNPVTTKADKISVTNIVPFASCDVGKMCGVCLPKIASEWDLTAEDTVNVETKIPLVEDSELKCVNGGKITLKFDPVKAVPPANKKPNIIDQAKAKINSAVNSVVKNVTEALQDISGSITGALDGLKPVLANTQVAGLANSLDSQLQKLNKFKKETDDEVKDLDKEVEEFKKKVEAKITGKPYQKPTGEAETGTSTGTTASTNTIDFENEEEEKRNQELFDQGTNDAIKEFEDFLNSEITPTAPTTATAITQDKRNSNKNTSTDIENTEKIITLTDKNNNPQEDTANQSFIEKTTATSKQLGLDVNEDAQKGLLALSYVESALGGQASNDAERVVKDRIKNERLTLNAVVQEKIDQELKDLGYYEKLEKYNQESADLQKDIDKGSLALKSIGDFGGFIDGLKNKYIGKLSAKYKKSINQLSENLATLNTSLDGLSYIADGLPKGEVFTHVKREIKEEEEEEDPLGAGINPGDGSSDPRDDKNLEPRILRIFIADINKKEFKESAVDVDTELYIVIQANAKANGKKVELDFKKQIDSYEMVDSYGENGEGNYVIPNINGASPNFEEGEAYVNDGLPYNGQAVESTTGNLADKTYVKVKAISPTIEEETT